MLFEVSFLSVSAFRKLPAAVSRHDSNDEFEPGTSIFHAYMDSVPCFRGREGNPIGKYESAGISKKCVAKEEEEGE